MNNPRQRWMLQNGDCRLNYSMGFRDACNAIGVDPRTIQSANKAVDWTEAELKNIRAGVDPATGPYAPTSHLTA